MSKRTNFSVNQN